VDIELSVGVKIQLGVIFIQKKSFKVHWRKKKVNGIPINNIRYADDTILIAEIIEDLQSLA